MKSLILLGFSRFTNHGISVFTGLIENCQPLISFDNARLTIDQVFEVSVGDSVAIDGCCLTVSECHQSSMIFELSAETLATTHFVATLANVAINSYRVNIERAMVFGSRLHGHLVSGHVDGVATVVDRTDRGLFILALPRCYARYLANKGSLAVNGVSLTITRTTMKEDSCIVQLTLIATTLAKTNLGMVAIGQTVNFEIDLIARYLDKLRSD